MSTGTRTSLENRGVDTLDINDRESGPSVPVTGGTWRQPDLTGTRPNPLTYLESEDLRMTQNSFFVLGTCRRTSERVCGKPTRGVVVGPTDKPHRVLVSVVSKLVINIFVDLPLVNKSRTLNTRKNYRCFKFRGVCKFPVVLPGHLHIKDKSFNVKEDT